MAKYDTYNVSRVIGSSSSPVNRSVTVLFEDGDVAVEVLEAADALLGVTDDPGAVTVEDALLELPRSELVQLLREVWRTQMNALGNDKYAYANQLRDAVNYGQNG